MRATEIASAVTARQTTAMEIAEQALARIAASDLNAVVTIDPERTRADAKAVDRRVASGETLPLAGVPIVVKDNIWVEGWRITQGSRLFADFVAPEDAIAITRLRRAGAVIVGIGATSEFACKGVTTSPLYGPTRHPLDPRLTPGGSSGGPAVAVAAGQVPLAIGTDAGGSSRRPPAHVGVVGFKPSYGAIPYGPGFAEPFWRISAIAPITTDVADASLAFDVMAGADARDPDSFDLPSAAAGAPLRLAFSPRLGLDVSVDDAVSAGLQQAVDRVRASGLAILDKDPVWPADLAEDAVMPLQHAGLAALYGDALRSDPTQFDPDIARQIERGLGLSGAEVGRALEASTQIARAFAAFFTEVDVLLAPTVPCVAWPFTQLGPSEIGGKAASPRAHAVFTPFANHAGVPAISIPCGVNSRDLPFGLQLIAARGHDRVLLEVAAQAERVFRG
ncbi:Putative Glutamyl-tRNA(Gln) amidotransferase subunit A (Glu-ADT subunit A) [Bradyrhizobium sp. ORS 285]|uniref:amidase n=1 Tax=Bradyrhizobium sp. ORS 285 TaxID=115808 RepID=UPI000240A69F|nr:amidase [Bradyrhizobium sp. ORS 285]CCD89972.1 putative Glutamyl-tRNA(Gln) amidotransferase subunit A (Glu-ADT subunit A) [Bradyrhizobium sp. ORS 285]SMX55683.1 Putative Glutamyl-tRNA(Gln) amidotransferase subunit A (Glu-ADT subunit A) [Bradyrhizobium sp. ORS 285]